jgi:hypothetical protein
MKLKRTAARWIRRVGRSSIGMLVPAGAKRWFVELAKKVLGESVLQARTAGSRLTATTSGRKSVKQTAVRQLGLVVAFDGADARQFRTEAVDHADPRPDGWADLAHLDLLLTDRPSTWSNDEERHRALERVDATMVDIRDHLPPIPDGITPLGFDRDIRDGYVCIVADGVGHAAPRTELRPPPGREIDVLTAGQLADPHERPERWAEPFQTYFGLLDHSAHWDDQRARAIQLSRVAASGLPVVLCDLDRSRELLAPLLPEPVLDAFAATEAADLTEPHRRARVAARQWAVVHDTLAARNFFDSALVASGRAGLPPKSVSVIIATNRPDKIDNWASQVADQRGVDHECVAVLHGDAFTGAHERRILSHLGDHATVLRAPAEHRLGDLLNTASAAAAGDLIVKWDDDDLYDRHHLADMARTHGYSGATIVGKACEYVYLAGPDVTVQRNQGRVETFSATLAGGTLCIARGDLTEVGGWRRAPRRVDSLLIETVLAAGGLSYRAIGLGYIMFRAAASHHAHTWNVGDDHFLLPGFRQRRGLDLDFAGVDTVAPAPTTEAPQ